MFEEGQEILDKRYRVIKKLGGGAFGEIYKGTSCLSVCPYQPKTTILLWLENGTWACLTHQEVSVSFIAPFSYLYATKMDAASLKQSHFVFNINTAVVPCSQNASLNLIDTDFLSQATYR